MNNKAKIKNLLDNFDRLVSKEFINNWLKNKLPEIRNRKLTENN